MDPALATEGGRYLITQGILGVLAVAQGFVIWRLYVDRQRAERQLHDLTVKYVEVMGELSRAIEERNKILDALSGAIADMGNGFRALGALLNEQHNRLLDRVAEILRAKLEGRRD